MTSGETQLVLTTCSDPGEAETLAAALVAERLAACVNIVTGVTSVYRWQGGVEHGAEVLLLIKTTRERFAGLEAAIRSRSSYELPEVLAVSVADGSAAFLNWVAEAVTNEG